MDAGLGGEAGPDEVLAVEVADQHVLVPRREGVQPAVGVLLQHAEEGQVELVAVGLQVAEDAHAAVDVVEDEAAEVADERLGAKGHRDEVVVGAEVGDLLLDEPLLHGAEGAQPVAALADVGADDAQLLADHAVEVERGGDLHAPIDWLEAGVAVKEIEVEREVLAEEELAGPAEELLLQ